MQLNTISIPRTARYYTLGDAGPDTREIWFVLHGYGQLAGYFVRHFEGIAGEERLIVAPEALSRFYVNHDPERIGASWMTREHREAEIQDYMAYLNQVAAQTIKGINNEVSITVLGFSQGATAASRWVTLGGFRAKRLILWGGSIAHDLDLAAHASTLNNLYLTYVVGNRDHFATPARVEEEIGRLDRHGISHRSIFFEGGHRIDKEVVAQLSGFRIDFYTDEAKPGRTCE